MAIIGDPFLIFEEVGTHQPKSLAQAKEGKRKDLKISQAKPATDLKYPRPGL